MNAPEQPDNEERYSRNGFAAGHANRSDADSRGSTGSRAQGAESRAGGHANGNGDTSATGRPKSGLMKPKELPKANILLVDDRADKLLAIEAILSSLDQNIVKARSGKEALRCLLQQDFAAILLDVSMPVMDGFETAALIRQRVSSEHTPIIFITSINSSENHISK